MTRSNTGLHNTAHSKVLHTAVFVIAMISLMSNGSNARAASVMPTDYRVAVAGDKFADTWQFAVAFRMRPPRRLRAKRVEVAVGTLSTSQENRFFVSLGPVWQLPIRSQSLFFELGISPTLLSGSSYNGRDVGGKFHFVSSAALSATFGARDSITLSLRIQHMSNGGLNSTNPGMDMIGLTFTFNAFDQ